jgi:hypothetical protein
MSKTKKPPVDRAEATIKRSTRTDVEMVTVTHEIAQAMPASPDWATSPTLQALVKAWDGDATAIDAQAKVVVGLRAQLKTAVATQASLRRDWQVSKAQVLAAVTSLCGGSADRVKALDLDVSTHTRLGALGAPAGLAVNPGKANGDVLASWLKGIARHGFLVQHASDPNTVATISAAIACTKQKLTLTGMPAGASLSFRVAAIDPASPTGQSPWSAWVVGNAK